MRLADGRFIFGILPLEAWREWRFGLYDGCIARWLDLGPVYFGWRHPCDQ